MTTTCTRCGRVLNTKQAVITRAGVYCRHHADRLPPYLRRPRPASPLVKETA